MTAQQLAFGFMRRGPAAALMVAGLSLIGAPAAPARPAEPSHTVALPVDAETKVNGVDLACTGIGQTRDDPRWGAYGVRVEFSNARNEYLAGAAMELRDRTGREILSVSCDAPWILLRLPPGGYSVEGRLLESTAKPRSATFKPPAQGQTRVVLQFPDA